MSEIPILPIVPPPIGSGLMTITMTGGGGGGNGTPRFGDKHVRSSSDITFNLRVNAIVNPICGEARPVYEGRGSSRS